MEEYVNIFNKYSKICTSNSYSVSPEYVYNNNKREIIGYKSYMNIPCQFKSMKLFNELLSSITSDSNPIKADIILSSVNWVISSELQSSLNSQLKIDAIKQAGVTAKQMGESLGSECSILKVSFLNGVYSPSQPLFESAKLASVNVSQPNQSDKSVSITAKYKLKCF
ncbi:MAG: hypothetical protein C0603_07435 [Denitrovibrio sp.]|nr:MAG: hypothetical protein C0603_07435 [Denitrovibrio sp.]